MEEVLKKTWYVLREGSSCDGMGVPSFIRRTQQPLDARFHLKKKRTPYEFWDVIVITDTSMRYVRDVEEL